MRKLATTLGLLASTVIGLSACSKSDDAMTEQQFCQEYAKRECAAVAPLCNYPATSCEPVRTTECLTRDGLWKTTASGTRPYQAGNAAACLDKVNEAYGMLPIKSDELHALQDTCARVFQGTAKATEICALDIDCAGSLICDPSKGRCGDKKQVASAAGCANIGEICPAGEFCKALSGTFLCTPRPAQGAPCSVAEPCLESLRCMATCVNRVPQGEACATDGDCATSYCSPYSHRCGVGLVFAEGSDSCRAYTGAAPAPDAGSAADTSAD